MKRLAAAFVAWAFAASSAVACDVALALAIDVSGSIDPLEYRTQMDGLAEALNDADVRDALVAARAQVTVLQWSGANRQAVTVPWTATETDADIDRLLASLRSAPRAYRHFSTAIGDAVLAAATLHEEIRGQCKRAVIDVSGDGQSNEGVTLAVMRRRLSRIEITVNGLAIEKDDKSLSAYFRAELATGPGAFVMRAADFDDYARAMRRKLLQEVAIPIVRLGSGADIARSE